MYQDIIDLLGFVYGEETNKSMDPICGPIAGKDQMPNQAAYLVIATRVVVTFVIVMRENNRLISQQTNMPVDGRVS